MTTTVKKTKALKVPKPVPEHRDKLNRKLALNDMVAYAHGNGLHIGKIIKLNPKMIGVERVSNEKWGRSQANIYPNDMIQLEGPEVTFYILKNSA